MPERETEGHSGEYVKAVLEPFWDCPSCGRRHISTIAWRDETKTEVLGANYTCPACFYHRHGTETYYVSDDSAELTDPQQIAQLKRPLWVCQACHALNEYPQLAENMQLQVDDLYCDRCNSWQVDFPGIPQAQGEREIDDRTHASAAVAPQAEAAKSARRRWVRRGIAAATGLAIGGGGFALYQGNRWQTVEATVTGLQWRSQLPIERYAIVTKSNWRRSIPTSGSDFQILKVQQRQSGTQRVQDGTETYTEQERYIAEYRSETVTRTVSERVQDGTKEVCKTVMTGNVAEKRCHQEPVYTTRSRQVSETEQVPVYATRTVTKTRPRWKQVPVYEDWVTYRIGEWSPVKTLVRQGTGNRPQLPDRKKFPPPAFRPGTPTVTCTATFRTPVFPDTHTLPIACDRLPELAPNQPVAVRYRPWGGKASLQWVGDRQTAR